MDTGNNNNTSQTRRSRRNRPPANPSAQTQMAAVDMLQTINTVASQTAASVLINDVTPNKTESLKFCLLNLSERAICWNRCKPTRPKLS